MTESRRDGAFGLRIALVLILAVSLVAVLAPAAHARDYHFLRLDIEAKVLPDGSMAITEERTVRFQGTFRGMFQWIPTVGETDIVDVVVSEDGVPLELDPGRSERAGTYYVVDERDLVYIDWSFSASDETRTFTLQYRLLNAVTVHEDVAELYHQFVGDEWDRGTDEVTVRLLLPEGASTGDIRAWGHGPLHGEVTIEGPREVSWKASPLPAETYLEGRVVFPTGLVAGAAVRSGRDALPGILEEERALASAANRRRLMARLDLALAGIALLAGIGGAFFFWYSYGKEYRPSFSGDYYRELPADYTPAELGVLWRFGSPGTDDFTATIMDLARKKWLRIEAFDREQRGLLRTRTETDYRLVALEGSGDRKKHEEDVLRFLFSVVARGDEVTFSEITSYARRNRSSFARFWQDWVSEVSAAGERLNFFDGATRTAQYVELAGAGLFFALGALGIYVGMHFTGVGFIVGAVALGIGGAVLRRRSRQGAEDFARWRAFRRFLLHFSEMQRHEIPSLAIWDHYLVYAVTLGVAKEVIRQLELVYPNLREGTHRLGAGWFLMRGTGAGIAGMSSAIDTLGSGMRQTVRTATSASASGAGRGGGFSGGGGGGTGGGGGGAR